MRGRRLRRVIGMKTTSGSPRSQRISDREDTSWRGDRLQRIAMHTTNAALTGCTTAAMDQFADEYLPQHRYAAAAACATAASDYHCGSNPSECEPAAAAYPQHHHHAHLHKDGGEYFAEPYYYDTAIGYCGGYGGPYDAYGGGDDNNWSSSSPQEYSSSAGVVVDGSQWNWTPSEVAGPPQLTPLTLHPPPAPVPLQAPEPVGFCDVVDDFRSAEHGLMQFQPGRDSADQTTCSSTAAATSAAAAADQLFFSKSAHPAAHTSYTYMVHNRRLEV